MQNKETKDTCTTVIGQGEVYTQYLYTKEPYANTTVFHRRGWDLLNGIVRNSWKAEQSFRRQIYMT